MKKSPLASILSIVFIDLIGFGMIIPILPLYAQRFQATEWQIGILLASYSFMQFLASPVLGWLSDRYGRKPVLLCSLVGSAAGYLLMANAASLEMLFAARILAGVAGASVGTASAYIADITPPENRSKRIGLIGAAFGIGFVLGPAIGGILSHFSVIAPFWFAAILSVLNAILMWMVLPEPERHAARQKGPLNLKDTFEQAGSWRLGVITVTYFIAIAGFAIVTVIYPQVSHRRFELRSEPDQLYFRNDGPDRGCYSGRRHRATRQTIWGCKPCYHRLCSHGRQHDVDAVRELSSHFPLIQHRTCDWQ